MQFCEEDGTPACMVCAIIALEQRRHTFEDEEMQLIWLSEEEEEEIFDNVDWMLMDANNAEAAGKWPGSHETYYQSYGLLSKAG